MNFKAMHKSLIFACSILLTSMSSDASEPVGYVYYYDDIRYWVMNDSRYSTPDDACRAVVIPDYKYLYSEIHNVYNANCHFSHKTLGGDHSLGIVGSFHSCREGGVVRNQSNGILHDLCEHPIMNLDCPVGRACKDMGPPPCKQGTSHPIAYATGNKFLEERDFPSVRFFSRSFNQFNTENNADIFLQLSVGSVAPFGMGWSSSAFSRVVKTSWDNAAWAVRPDGRLLSFKRIDGTWVSGVNIPDRLIQSGSGWKYVNFSSNSLEFYDLNGELISVNYANGEAWSLTDVRGSISDYRRTVFIKNQVGRVIELDMDSFGRAVGARFDGYAIQYIYDEKNRISKVVYPDASFKSYVYESQSLPRAITGLIDENGNRYSTYAYDDQGRAIGEYQGNLIGAIGLGFENGHTAVTDQLGVQRNYDWQEIHGKTYLTSQSQPAGSGCNASSKSLSYDAQGNVASKTDFNGTTTVYTNDLSRNLEVQRMESSGQSTARTISTEWHPVWRLKTRVAEPGLITTSVYNGQPDPSAGGAVASCAPADALLPDGSPIAVLCKRIEQATLDANGSAGFAAPADPASPVRMWQYTYNRFGQVLSEDGPRTDVADITTHVYHADTSFVGSGAAAQGHTLGDLASTTDPSGQTTTYDLYNKHGQLLQSTDPNGIVSTYTYDLRQRLTSASVGGQTTTYTYDPAGQLIQVSLPDGSRVTHTYDPAHRLIASADHLGNRIDYSLDNAGNVIGQTLKDPNGTLRHSLQQSRDALGRVQQTQAPQ
jgi:YD repeat-containing protein